MLSISTFQRNRTCCELVQSIVAASAPHATAPASYPLSASAPATSLVTATEAGRRDTSSLYLLHTGNIFKLRDSSVPPKMREC